MARILIVGGGCRGRALASRAVQRGHAVRITTRQELGRPAIEAAGAECWIGTPDRLATLRGSLDGVAVACWLLAQASGDPEQVEALHSSRLELFLTQAIDTTARGLVYDASPGCLAPGVLAGGERIFGAITRLNAIPAAVIRAREQAAWLAQAERAVGSLLGG